MDYFPNTSTIPKGGTILFSSSVALLFGYVLWSLPSVLLALLVVCGGRWLVRWRRGRSVRWPRELVVLLFVCYLAFLLSITLNLEMVWVSLFHGWIPPAPRWFQGGLNLHLWSGLRVDSLWEGIMLVGNVAMFLPLGFFLPLLWRWKGVIPVVAVGAVLSLSIEGMQFVIGRALDVGDVFLNTLGTALGWLLYTKVSMVQFRT